MTAACALVCLLLTLACGSSDGEGEGHEAASPISTPSSQDLSPSTPSTTTSEVVSPPLGTDAEIPWDPAAARAARGAIASVLFDLLVSTRDLEEEAPVFQVEREGVHQFGRGEFASSNWRVLHDVDLDAFREALGESAHQGTARAVAAYDRTARPADHEALGHFLGALWLDPETEILGSTAADLFPVFRRQARLEWRLYACAVQELEGRTLELEQAFRDSPEYTPAGKSWDQVYFERNDDRRRFYAWLTYGRDLPSRCGIAPGDASHLDVGFWVRRVEDGTAPLLGAWLRRVLVTYDGEWLAGMDATGIEPFVVDGAWYEGRRAEYVSVEPLDWGEHYYILESGGETFTTEAGKRVRFEPPRDVEIPRVVTSADGDALVRLQRKGRRFFYDAAGRRILAIGRESGWLDAATFEVLRPLPDLLPGDVAEAERTPDGRLIAVVIPSPDGGGAGLTLLLDAESGEISERMEGFAPDRGLAVSYDGSILAGSRATGGTEIRYRGEASREPIRLSGWGNPAIHPLHPLLVVGKLESSLVDLATGEVLADLAPGRFAFQRAFSPDGALLWTAFLDSGVVERFDPETRSLAPHQTYGKSTIRAWWLPHGKLLLLEDSLARVYDAGSGEPIGRPVRAIDVLAADPDGGSVLLALRDDVLLWRLEWPKGPTPTAAPGPIAVEVSPIGAEPYFTFTIRNTGTDPVPLGDLKVVLHLTDAQGGTFRKPLYDLRGPEYAPDRFFLQPGETDLVDDNLLERSGCAWRISRNGLMIEFLPCIPEGTYTLRVLLEDGSGIRAVGNPVAIALAAG